MGLYPSVKGHLVYPWCGKAEETPPLIFGVLCSHFVGLGSSEVGLKLCISPLGCTGGRGRVVGPYPLWDSVSGSPVHWGVWSIPPPTIFGCGAVRCGVSSDRYTQGRPYV